MTDPERTETSTPKPASQEIAALYDSSVAEPLHATLVATDKLLPLLAALPEAEKQAIRHDKDRPQNSEAFIAPDMLAALPALARHAQAMEGFFQKVRADETLTQNEVTAASLRYEPFDQLTATAEAISASLKKLPGDHSEVIAATDTLVASGKAVQQGITGGSLDESRRLDGVFLSAVNEHAAKPAATLDTPVETSVNAVALATEKLLPRLEALPAEDKANLAKLAEEFEKQCKLSEHSIPLTERDLSGQGALTDLANGPRALNSFLEATKGSKTRDLSLWEEAATDSPAAALNAWRVPVRALHAILNAANITVDGQPFDQSNLSQPGKYDELLALTAPITAQSWEVQKAGPDLKPLKAEYNAKPLSVPPTAVQGAQGESIAPAAEQQREP